MVNNGAPHVPLFRSRREFLRLAGGGFGSLAFAAMDEFFEEIETSPAGQFRS